MRQALVLGIVVIALAAAACGASAADHTPIVFGIRGGNIPPYVVTIQPNGTVRITKGSLPNIRRQIAVTQVRRLRNEIRRSHLVSRRCPGVLPDFAAKYIRVSGRIVAVQGTCEPRFARVWNALLRAVTRRSG